MQQAPGPKLALNISRRAFVMACSMVIFGYFALWLLNFKDIYGWIMDDGYYFYRGTKIVENPWKLFDTWNYVHLNHLIFGTLPILLNYDIPSLTLPEFEARTGIFRGFLLLTILLHGALIALWMIILDRLRLNRLIALAAFLLFVTGPTLTFWAPLPDSRMLGLLAFLPGWLILFRLDTAHRLAIPRPWGRTAFWVGVLFSLSQSLQYTTIYIIMPVLFVYFSHAMITCRDRIGVARMALACLAGCLTVPLVTELLSAAAGVPTALGPFMTYLERWNAHRAFDTLEPPRVMWLRMFTLELGWPLCGLAVVGLAAALAGSGTRSGVDRRTLSLLAVVIVIGLCQQFFSGSQAMFRQVSVLLPFLFIFVAIGAVAVASVVPGPRARAAVAAVILVVAAIIPVRESITVFRAQRGLGEVMDWAAAAADGHRVRWLPIAWFAPGETAVRTEAELRNLDPDDLLITYFPYTFLNTYPEVEAVLNRLPPLYSRPTLYTTNAMWCETHARGSPDIRRVPVRSEARVYRVGDLLEQWPAR